MDIEIVLWGLTFVVCLFIFYMTRLLSIQEWKAAAELCGLQIVKVSRLPPRVAARSGEVEAWIGASADKERPTRIVVKAPGPPGFQDVSIRRPLFGEDIEIREPNFDGRFVVEGPAQLVSALLDRDTRLLLARLHADWEWRMTP